MNDNTGIDEPANIGIAQPATQPPPGYREVLVKAVIAFDDNGSYLIHGSSDEEVPAMAKAIQPLWNHDPSQEAVQYVEMKMWLPIISEMRKPIPWV